MRKVPKIRPGRRLHDAANANECNRTSSYESQIAKERAGFPRGTIHLYISQRAAKSKPSHGEFVAATRPRRTSRETKSPALFRPVPESDTVSKLTVN